MPDFAYWLRTKANPDPATGALRAFADARADWPWWADRLKDYVAVIQTANPENKDDLISTVSVNYGRWESEQGLPGGMLSNLGRNIATLFLALFGTIVGAAILYGLFISQDFFRLMADFSQARGLITFLFAFSTIAIILLVAISTFWMPKDEVPVRFEKAKDLLTIIIGVLGTILGFYFGSLAAPERQPASLPNLQAAPTSMIPEARQSGAGEAGR